MTGTTLTVTETLLPYTITDTRDHQAPDDGGQFLAGVVLAA